MKFRFVRCSLIFPESEDQSEESLEELNEQRRNRQTGDVWGTPHTENTTTSTVSESQHADDEHFVKSVLLYWF